MTFMRVWTIVRWPIAIVALAAVVQYAYPRFVETLPTMIDFDPSGSLLDFSEPTETPTPSEIAQEPLPEPTLEAPTGPVTDGFAGPIVDYFVNDTVADTDDESLILSDDLGDSVVIAFALPPGDPGCMSSVSLTLNTSEVLSPTQIGIFPSSETDTSLVDNTQVDGDLRADDQQMAGGLIETGGTVTYDITAGYQRYFTLEQPPGAPFALTIVATDAVESRGGVRFAASELDNEQVPTLSWVGTPGCPVDTGPTPTPTPQ